MDLDAAVKAFAMLHVEYGSTLDAGLLIFARVLAFVFFSPVFNRKDLAFNIKLAMALFLTVALFWMVPLDGQASMPNDNTGIFLYLVFINVLIGGFLGFIADLILHAIYACGDVINNQIGLSSAMFTDPATKKQAALMETLFAFMATVLFIYAGGLHWLIMALKRSFTLFPVYDMQPAVLETINMAYLVKISSQLLLIGVELAAPVMVVTMAVDIILAVVNRTAQQIPVYQLSFGIKPSIGVIVILATLPIFLNTVMSYLSDYSLFF